MAEKEYIIKVSDESHIYSEVYNNLGSTTYAIRSNYVNLGYIYAMSLNYLTTSDTIRPKIDTTRPLFSKRGEYMGSVLIKANGEVETTILNGFTKEDWRPQPIEIFMDDSHVGENHNEVTE